MSTDVISRLNISLKNENFTFHYIFITGTIWQSTAKRKHYIGGRGGGGGHGLLEGIWPRRDCANIGGGILKKRKIYFKKKTFKSN